MSADIDTDIIIGWTDTDTDNAVLAHPYLSFQIVWNCSLNLLLLPFLISHINVERWS